MTSMPKKTVLYMRYSSNNQRQDSIPDQRRNIVNHLSSINIPFENAIELSDEAISGKHSNRPGYQKLMAMIDKGEVELLAVDDLSRFSRMDEIGTLWDKMEVYGGRFISVLDGIDSIREGDEITALFKGAMNKMTNKLHGKRVRRGLAGRALTPLASTGGHPYGYGSRHCDQQAALNYSGSGPRPKKEVFIDEEEARTVREIFRLFVVEGWSKAKVVRHLNENHVPTGKRSRIVTEFGTSANPMWNKTRVSRILEQRKYIGVWRYGENICKITEKGKHVIRPANPRDIIEVNNPELAIISQEVWDKAQERLATFKDMKGYKFGQKKRGPNRHYTEDYPNGTCGGVVYCGDCGKKMYRVPEFIKNNQKYGPYHRCANAIANGMDERGGRCGHKSFVREDRIFEALAGYVDNHLRACDGWLGTVVLELRKACASHNASVPGELKQLRERRKEIAVSIENITTAIERGGRDTPETLLKRLKNLETEVDGIDSELRRLSANEEREASFPSDDWIKAQLAGLADVLAESPEKTGKLFRQLFDKVYVRTILSPGKTRGHSVISFVPNNISLVTQMAGLSETPGLEPPAHQGQSMVSIDLPGYDKLDKLMPMIDSMLREGRTWAYICRELGVTSKWAKTCYKNWKEFSETADEAPSALPSEHRLDSTAS